MLLMLLLLQHYPSWSELGHWKTPVKEMLKVNYCITFWLMVKLEKCIWYVAYHFFGCYALFSSKMVFKMRKRSEHIHFNSEYILLLFYSNFHPFYSNCYPFCSNFYPFCSNFDAYYSNFDTFFHPFYPYHAHKRFVMISVERVSAQANSTELSESRTLSHLW